MHMLKVLIYELGTGTGLFHAYLILSRVSASSIKSCRA